MRTSRPVPPPTRGPRRISTDTRVYVCCDHCDAHLGIYENKWIRLTAKYVVAVETGRHFATTFGKDEKPIPYAQEKRLVDGCTVSEARCRKCDKMIGQLCVAPGSAAADSLVGEIFYRLSKIHLIQVTSREPADPFFDNPPESSPGLLSEPYRAKSPSNPPHPTNNNQSRRNVLKTIEKGYSGYDRRSSELPGDDRLYRDYDNDDGAGYESNMEGMEKGDSEIILQKVTQQGLDIHRISESLDKLQVQMQGFGRYLKDIKGGKDKASSGDPNLLKSIQSAVEGLQKSGTESQEIKRLQMENEQLRKRLEFLTDAIGSALASKGQQNAPTSSHDQPPSMQHPPRNAVPNKPSKDKPNLTEKKLQPGMPLKAPMMPGMMPGPTVAGVKRKLPQTSQQNANPPAKRASGLRNEVHPVSSPGSEIKTPGSSTQWDADGRHGSTDKRTPIASGFDAPNTLLSGGRLIGTNNVSSANSLLHSPQTTEGATADVNGLDLHSFSDTIGKRLQPTVGSNHVNGTNTTSLEDDISEAQVVPNDDETIPDDDDDELFSGSQTGANGNDTPDTTRNSQPPPAPPTENRDATSDKPDKTETTQDTAQSPHPVVKAEPESPSVSTKQNGINLHTSQKKDAGTVSSISRTNQPPTFGRDSVPKRTVPAPVPIPKPAPRPRSVAPPPSTLLTESTGKANASPNINPTKPTVNETASNKGGSGTDKDKEKEKENNTKTGTSSSSSSNSGKISSATNDIPIDPLLEQNNFSAMSMEELDRLAQETIEREEMMELDGGVL